MNILCVGGCGYIGALLVPQLLAEGHKVTVVDTQWFGNGHLPGDNENLTIIKGDIRNEEALRRDMEGKDVVIWLASLSNNAMYGVDYDLTHAVNTTVHYSPRFIYASSVAVLDPTSDYAKDKLACEEKLKDTGAIIVRSASVCGYSPHQRFDLTLNMMTHDAYRKGVITVNGGEQERCHIHIQDLCDFYKLLLKKGVDGETYIPWAQSTKIKWSAQTVADIFTDAKRPVRIETQGRSDNRSYCVNGDSARSIDWFPKKAVWDGVRDLIVKFDSGYWPDSLTNPIYQNIAHGLV